VTSAELVERALRRITPVPAEAASLRTALLTQVEDALRLLPIRVSELLGQAEAEIYRKNYTVALTSGQGSLATHTNLALASEPMIASEITKVTHPNAVSAYNATGKLTRLGSESSLSLPHSLEFAYYAIEDNTLYTMMNDDRTTLTGNATVRAAFPPAIGNVKESHEALLVDLLVERIGVKAA
jgi:hypothetical protein